MGPRGPGGSILRPTEKARNTGYTNHSVCVALIGELSQEVQPQIKSWVKGKEECSEKDVREFVTLVQVWLIQRRLGLEYGACETGAMSIRVVETVPIKPQNTNSDEGESTKGEEVYRIHSSRKSRGATVHPNTRYGKPKFRWFSCGKVGQGWRTCTARKRDKELNERQYETYNPVRTPHKDDRNVYCLDYEQ